MQRLQSGELHASSQDLQQPKAKKNVGFDNNKPGSKLGLQLELPDLQQLTSEVSRTKRTSVQAELIRRSPSERAVVATIDNDPQLLQLIQARSSRTSRLVTSPRDLDKDFRWNLLNRNEGVDLDTIDAILSSAGAGHLSLATALRAVELTKPLDQPSEQWIRDTAEDQEEVQRIIDEAKHLSRTIHQSYASSSLESGSASVTHTSSGAMKQSAKFVNASSPDSEEPSKQTGGLLDSWHAQHVLKTSPNKLKATQKAKLKQDQALASALMHGDGSDFADMLDRIAESSSDEMLIERVLGLATDGFFEHLRTEVELEEKCAFSNAEQTSYKDDWLRRIANVLEAEQIDLVYPETAQGSLASLARIALAAFKEDGRAVQVFDWRKDTHKQDEFGTSSMLCVILVHIPHEASKDPVQRQEHAFKVLIARTYVGRSSSLWLPQQLDQAQWLAEIYCTIPQNECESFPTKPASERCIKHNMQDLGVTNRSQDIESQYTEYYSGYNIKRGTSDHTPLEQPYLGAAKAPSINIQTDIDSEKLFEAECKQRASFLPQQVVGCGATSFAELVKAVQDHCGIFFEAQRASLLVCRDMQNHAVYFGHGSTMEASQLRILNSLLDPAKNKEQNREALMQSFRATTSHLEAKSLKTLQRAKDRINSPARRKKQRNPSTQRRLERGASRRSSLSRRKSLLETSDLIDTIMEEDRTLEANPWVLVVVPGDNPSVRPTHAIFGENTALTWNISSSHPLAIGAKSRQSIIWSGDDKSELCIPLYVSDFALREDEEVYMGILRLERDLREAQPFTLRDKMVADECAPIIANALSQYLRDAGDRQKRATTMKEWEGEVATLGQACTIQAHMVDALREILKVDSLVSFCETISKKLATFLWASESKPHLCAEELQLSDETLLGPCAKAFHENLLAVYAPSAWASEIECEDYKIPIAESISGLYTQNQPDLPKLNLPRTACSPRSVTFTSSTGHITSWPESHIDKEKVFPSSNRGANPNERTRSKGAGAPRKEIIPSMFSDDQYIEQVAPRSRKGKYTPESLDRGISYTMNQPHLVQLLGRSLDTRNLALASLVHIPSQRRRLLPLEKSSCRGDTDDLQSTIHILSEEETLDWEAWTQQDCKDDASCGTWAFEFAFSLQGRPSASQMIQTTENDAQMDVVYFRQALVVNEEYFDDDLCSWELEDILYSNSFGDIELNRWINTMMETLICASNQLRELDTFRQEVKDGYLQEDSFLGELSDSAMTHLRSYLEQHGLVDRATLLDELDYDRRIPYGILACGDLRTLYSRHNLPSREDLPEEKAGLPSRPLKQLQRARDELDGPEDSLNRATSLRSWSFYSTGSTNRLPFGSSAQSSGVQSSLCRNGQRVTNPSCSGIIEHAKIILEASDIYIHLFPSSNAEEELLTRIYSTTRSSDQAWKPSRIAAESDPVLFAEAFQVKTDLKPNQTMHWYFSPNGDRTVATVPLWGTVSGQQHLETRHCFGVCQYTFDHSSVVTTECEQLILGCTSAVAFDVDLCLHIEETSLRLNEVKMMNCGISDLVYHLSLPLESAWVRLLECVEKLSGLISEILPCERVISLVSVRYRDELVLIDFDEASIQDEPIIDELPASRYVFLDENSDLAIHKLLKGNSTSPIIDTTGDYSAMNDWLKDVSVTSSCAWPIFNSIPGQLQAILLLVNRRHSDANHSLLHTQSWLHAGTAVHASACFNDIDLAALQRLSSLVSQLLSE